MNLPNKQQSGGYQYLAGLPLWERGEFSPLDVPIKILAELDNPQDAIPAVHVAGSNGKGTVCAAMAAILRCSGAEVGHFASPHLSRVEERCLINGEPVAVSEFDAALCAVREAAARRSCVPSYFVATAAATFLEFRRRSLDRQVVEVGLGGRFDATNTIAKPEVCIITSISIDHTTHLGRTLAEIAWNKAGILKAGVPVVTAAGAPEVESVLSAEAERVGAPLVILTAEEQERLLAGSGSGALREALRTKTRHERENLLLAVKAAAILGLPAGAVEQGIARMRWPGRGELLPVDKHRLGKAAESSLPPVPVLLDAAHNTGAVGALFEHLDRILSQRKNLSRVIFVFSVLKQKDWREMLALIDRRCRSRSQFEFHWLFTASANINAVDPAELQAAAGRGRSYRSAEMALSAALSQADESTLVVVFGSIYLLGEVRPLLTDRPFATIAD